MFPGRRTVWINDVRRWTLDRRHERGENKCNGKKIRLLVAGCLRVVRPTAYEQRTNNKILHSQEASRGLSAAVGILVLDDLGRRISLSLARSGSACFDYFSYFISLLYLYRSSLKGSC